MEQFKKIFITGGARSGKSRFAQKTAEALGSRRVFVATAQALDTEMAARIARHQAERGPQWTTREAPLDLGAAVRDLAPHADVLLIDCVTLWISNLLLTRGAAAVDPAVRDLCAAMDQVAACHLVIVSNEVGAGIVPDNALARDFRDLAGVTNQRLAAACTDAFLMAAGLPLALKRHGAPCHTPIGHAAGQD